MTKSDMKIIDLRSDTVTKPSDEMREAMMTAEVGDDVFGEDPTVNQLQKKAADLFFMESALFVPSGTMANEIALKVHTQPGDEVIVDSLCHYVHFESGAPGLLSGVNLFSIQTSNGIITAEQIEKALRTDRIAYPQNSLISLENTHNYGGGVIFPLSEIENIASLAKRRSLRLHLDGARIFNAIAANGIKPKEYAQHFDSVMFSLSKGLGAPVGSLLMGSKDFIDQARRYRKMFGGGMRQIGMLGAAGIYALDNNVERLTEDHKNARILAEAFRSTSLFDINPKTVETNIIIIDITDKKTSPQEAEARLQEIGILVFPFGENSIRAVTHLDISGNDIDECCVRLRKYF